MNAVGGFGFVSAGKRPATAELAEATTKKSTRLPIDYQEVERLAIKRDKIVVEYTCIDPEIHLETYVMNQEGKTIAFEELWSEWGIHIAPYLETIYDSCDDEIGEREWIPVTELKKLEGFVVCFARWDRTFDGIEYIFHATYKVVNGQLIAAPEYRERFNFSEFWGEWNHIYREVSG
jgi:hypothetical protein